MNNSTTLDLNQTKEEFYKRHQAKIQNGEYHQADLDRLKSDTNNAWMRAFAKHGLDNMDKTVGVMDEVLKWRKDFGANDLLIPGKYPFAEEFFTRGALFKHNVDKSKHSMLFFIVKTHKKGQLPFDQLCRFIAFFLEREYKFNVDDPIVLCIDMYEAGYANLDMEMILFIVNCLKTYYPGLIDYLIIYQMPFIFNAVWKIIKNMLPAEAVKLVKFCDKKSIREFVNEDQLFVHMGGTDQYKYSYSPGMYAVKAAAAAATATSPSSPAPSQTSAAAKTKNDLSTNESSPDSSDKTVRFNEASDDEEVADEDEEEEKTQDAAINNKGGSATRKQRQKMESASQLNGGMTNGDSASNLAASNFKSSASLQQQTMKTTNSSQSILNGADTSLRTNNFDRSQATELSFGNELTTPLLSINPGDELVFNVKEGKSDIAQAIKLTNTSGVPLAYKIKITAPDKFRVKPGMGIIQTSACAQITINFLKEYHNSVQVHRDKFLILWTPINDSNVPSDINEFWKQAVQKKLPISEHKVKCIIARPGDQKLANAANATTSSIPTSMSVQAFTTKSSMSSAQLSKAAKSMTGIDSLTIPRTGAKGGHMVDISSPSTDSLVSAGDEINSSITLLNSKLTTLELNTNSVVKSQQKMNRQYTIQLYLIYFLILLNLMQLLFQSNVYADVIEPYIDHFVFQRKN